MSPKDFQQWVLSQELEEEVLTASYPHYSLLWWLECQRTATVDGITGRVSVGYPEPQKSWMEQDAELLLTFEVYDECKEEHQRLEELRTNLKKEAATLMNYR